MDRVNAALRPFVENGSRAGLVWAVAKDGELKGSGAYGSADLAKGRPMALDSIFRIYSMTRAVTAVAVLQLVERQVIGLDDPVSKYLPQFAELSVIDEIQADEVQTKPLVRPVTVEDLLTYTAGFGYARQYPESVGVNHRAILGLDQSADDAMRKLSSYPLRDQPGDRWRYGYHSDVLGALVEKVSGQPLDEVFRERIFAPLRMHDTGFHVPAAKRDRLVRAYDANLQDITDKLPPSSAYTRRTQFHSGGGGLVSTAKDWLRFAGMLANDGEFDGVRMLGAEFARAMRQNRITPSQGALFWHDGNGPGPAPAHRFRGYGWGYSVGVRLPDGDHTIDGRPGEIMWGGLANTAWFADPGTGLVALVFAQYLGANADELDAALRAALYRDP